MDPNLRCIDPNLLQLSQLLEEDEEVLPPIRTLPVGADRSGAGNKSAVEGKGRIDDAALSETFASFSEAKKRPAPEDNAITPNAAVSEEKKPRLDVEGEKAEDLRESAIKRTIRCHPTCILLCIITAHSLVVLALHVMCIHIWEA